MLSLQHIHKSFGQSEVLADVSLQVVAGEVLGLVGENGAGKSTLMNILGGLFPPTQGQVIYRSQKFAPPSPRASLEAGIAMIHQELNLFPNLTVYENLVLSDLPFLVSKKTALQRAQEMLEIVGLDIDPRRQLADLSHAQMQMVEIAKALGTDPQILIFDEPTTALSRHEATQLFKLIREQVDQQKAVIYISHNLEDVLALADRIAVLRDGRLVAEGPSSDLDKDELVKAMIGRSLNNYYPDHEEGLVAEPLLQVKDIRSPFCRDISFTIHAGEIVGFYGLVGAGRSEMARAIYGLDELEAGEIYWRGDRIEPVPKDWIKKGLIFLTEDRRSEGLLLTKGIHQNIRLASLPQFMAAWSHRVRRQEANEIAAQFVQATHLIHQDLDNQPVEQLSGGNQQKVVLAKWLMTKPSLLILDEPTKGIDIAAKKELYQLLRKLLKKGAGIILISSEIEELFGMCDRIAVMCEGQITGVFSRDGLQRELVMQAALPSQTQLTS